METTLINYIRDKQNNPKGVVVAVRDDDEIFYGFSLCNPVDKWDKQLGIKKAIARARASEYKLPDVLDRRQLVFDAIQKIQNRALNYFKDIPEDKVKIEIADED